MKINCDKCLKELEAQGALLFSPPDHQHKVVKIHLCKECWYTSFVDIFKLEDINDEYEQL